MFLQLRAETVDFRCYCCVCLAYVIFERRVPTEDQFEQALGINPDYAEVHNNLGAALGQMGRISEAIEELKAALRINPNYTDARNNLTKLEAFQNSTPSKIDPLKR